MMFCSKLLAGTLACGSLCLVSVAFTHPSFVRNRFAHRSHTPFLSSVASPLATQSDLINLEPDSIEEEQQVVRAPLNFIGPYPCLSLRFPNLSTSSQRARNLTGVALDFVLDTAANTNTIQSAVAQELDLEKIGMAPPGAGAAGAITGGDTFLLGDCELDVPKVSTENEDVVEEGGEVMEEETPFVFMTNLSASALPVASPAAAGLLGIAFLNCFQGGVEFQWGASQEDGQTLPPSVTFYGDKESSNTDGLTPVPITPLEGTYLPSIQITVNGVEIQALLDTGSPVTVLNSEAARLANIDLVEIGPPKKDGNPLANAFQGWTKNMEKAKAAAKGDILMIAGTSGQRVELIKTAKPIRIGASGVDLGNVPVYVGDLPGLAALGGLGASAPPAVVLGMDVLRRKKRMLYRSNEVYFK